MIARLRGEVAERGAGRLVIDVGGVGYDVHVPQRVADAAGDSVTLAIHTDVREDAIVLYGFSSSEDRAAFHQLRAIEGIGPKIALSCLNHLTVEALARAVNSGDVRTLCAVPGVGKKIADRIVLELKGKVASLGPGAVAASAARPSAVDDALPLALAQLGYKKSEIDLALSWLVETGKAEAPIPERIRLCLGRLSQGR